MSSIVLYNYFRSSTSYRVRLALHIKDLNFEYKPVNLLKGEQHSPEYRAMNPLGGVPTLVHDNKIIPESFAIMEYLDEVFPKKPLFPKDAYLKARVRQVCEVINSFMHPMGNLKTLQYLERSNGYTQDQKDGWVQHWAAQGLETLETTLQEFSGVYCFGNEVTMADLFLVPQMLTCNRFKVDLSNYPTLTKINNMCLSLEPFKKAHPFCQIDTPEEFKR